MPPPPETTRRTTLDDRTVVVRARRRDALVAWFLDGVIVWALVAAIWAGASAVSESVGSAVFALVVLGAWPAVAFCYGLTTAYRRSPGQLVAGTRTLRTRDGSVPGFWRAGWVMLSRMVLGVLGPLFFVLALVGGDQPGMGMRRHLSVDVGATARLSPSRSRSPRT